MRNLRVNQAGLMDEDGRRLYPEPVNAFVRGERRILNLAG